MQTHGQKDYYFRENTVAREPPSTVAFQRLGRETSPLMMATLLPGDLLSIPSRWWHMAHCIETSLSVSVGIWRGADRPESA